MTEAANEFERPSCEVRGASSPGLDPWLISRSLLGSSVAGGFSILVGLLVLAGWLFGVPILKSLLPGYASMKVNTSVGLIAAGVSLWLLRSAKAGGRVRLYGLVSAYLTLALGLLTIVEYGSGIDLGIDQLWFQDRESPRFPGRMAPASAISFGFLGLALVLMDVRIGRGFRPSSWIALLGSFCWMLVLIAYLYGAGDMFGSANFRSVALHTASAFLANFVGILLARPDREPVATLLSRSLGGLMARRLLPALILSFFMLGLIRQAGIRAGLLGDAFSVSLLVTAGIAIVSGIVLMNARNLARIDQERSKAEDGLRASERIYRAIGESIPFGVWICDPAGRNTYLSESFLKLVGLTQEQGSHFGWGDVLHPDDAERTVAAWKECVRTEGHWEIEHRYRGTDGQYHPVLARGTPVRDEQGQIVCWAGIQLDISRLKATEGELRASQERQRLALAAARLGNWEWDVKNDRVVSLNGLSLLFGRGEDQEFGNHEEFLSVVHPDDREVVRRAIDRSLTLGEPQEIEYRVLWPDGSVRWLATRGSSFFDPDGIAARMVGVSLDITERKYAEAQIRALNENLERRVEERTAELAEANLALFERKRRFRAIFDSTFQFIGLLSPEGILLEANQTALDFGGLTREEVVGHPFWEARWWTLSPETQEQLKQAIGAASAGQFIRYEVDIRGSGDNVAAIDFSLKPLKDDQGRVTLLIPEGRVITEQKQAAEALRRSEAALRESHRMAGVGSWEWDLTRDVVTWSDELFRIAGLDPNRPAPTYAEHRQIWSAESLARLDSAVANTLSTGQPYELELETIGIDGVARWLISRGEAVRDPDGQITKLRGTAQDVTARKRFEEELRRARDQAMAATQAKSEFLANMSHEIRTPMNGVIGMAELLLDTSLDGLQRDYAWTIRNSGEALLTVINDILDFSKIEAGKLTIEIVEFDLATLIGEVADLLAPRARQKGLEIQARVGSDVPIALKGDPIRIRQVLTNLAGNAVKFTEAGGVTIEARTLAVVDDQATVRILVEDTGIGIPEAHQADVFESFTQVDQGNNRRHGGTGLGLTICRSLVSLMGGQIGLRSSPGLGSTFWFELTLGLATRRADHKTSEPKPARGGSDLEAGWKSSPAVDVESSTDARRLQILLAEDNEVNRRVATGLLARLGCSVETVDNGRKATEALDYDRHDLILMDVQMPEMDGLEATAVIRALEKSTGRHIPIIAMTAHAMRGDSEKCLEAGMDGYLTKPLRPGPLLEAVRAWKIQARPALTGDHSGPTNEIGSKLRETLDQAFGGDQAMIADILDLLITETSALMERLEIAIQAKDTDQVAWEAHTLKGMFLNFGAEPLASTCQELFQLSDRGEILAARSAHTRLVRSWEILKAEAAFTLENCRNGR